VPAPYRDTRGSVFGTLCLLVGLAYISTSIVDSQPPGGTGSNTTTSDPETVTSSFSISLDLDESEGNQDFTSMLGVVTGSIVEIQMFGSNIQNATGFVARFEYDDAQLTFDGFDIGDALPNALSSGVEYGTNPTSIQIDATSIGSGVLLNDGNLGTVRFRVTSLDASTIVSLSFAELQRDGLWETSSPRQFVELAPSPSSDFDNDGTVGFTDFLQFAASFGSSVGDGVYDLRHDIDQSGEVGFSDFLIFAASFGTSLNASEGKQETQFEVDRDSIETPAGSIYETVLVPAGEFVMGSRQGGRSLPLWSEDFDSIFIQTTEEPAHTVSLKAFRIGKYEVTNSQFIEFLNARGSNEDDQGKKLFELQNGWGDSRDIINSDGVFSLDRETEEYLRTDLSLSTDYSLHPAAGVTWFGATSYCEWLGGRLPTEAEWEMAARGTDGRAYPWGHELQLERVNFDESGDPFEYDADTTPVGYYDGSKRNVYSHDFPNGYQTGDGRSSFGAHDMLGNVSEWCSDWYGRSYYLRSPEFNPMGPVDGEFKVIRGGGYSSRDRDKIDDDDGRDDPLWFLTHARTYSRDFDSPEYGYGGMAGSGGFYAGVRCAVDVPGFGFSALPNNSPIGPEGGLVVGSADGGPGVPFVSIPPEALFTNEEIEISLSVGSLDYHGKPSTRIVEFSPSGTQFNRPVEIGLPLPHGTTSAENIGAFHYVEGAWTPIPIVGVDLDQGILTALTDHFSFFVAEEEIAKFDLRLYKNGATAVGAVKLLTPFVELPVGLATALGSGSYNILHYLRNNPRILKVWFSVNLMKKRFGGNLAPNILGRESAIYRLRATVGGEDEDYEIDAKTFEGEWLLQTTGQHLDLVKAERYLSGEALLFSFDGITLEDDSEYYINTYLNFVQSVDWEMPIGWEVGIGGTYVSRKSIAQKPTDMTDVRTIDQNLNSIVDELEPTYVISGNVKAADQSPVRHATVDLRNSASELVETINTGSGSYFEFQAIAGTYTLSARKWQRHIATRGFTVRGTDLKVDLVAPLPKLYGYVVTAQNSPVAGVVITIRGGFTHKTATTDERGYFEFVILPERYTLQGEKSGYAISEESVAVGDDDVRVTLIATLLGSGDDGGADDGPSPPVTDGQSVQITTPAGTVHDMVVVPAGPFLIGSRNTPSESLETFHIDRYEVTNRKFVSYLTASGDNYRPQRESEVVGSIGAWRIAVGSAERPVVGVTWWDASGYCKWMGGSLPTEAQWEKSARGTDARRYPWGNQSPTPDLYNVSCRHRLYRGQKQRFRIGHFS
jgi:formylglycine-generating enzyme required for sulfatase activity